MGERGLHRIGRRMAVGAFVAMLAVGTVNAAETGAIGCEPDLESPTKGNYLVRLDEDILKRDSLTISQAVNRAVLCSRDGKATTISIAAGTYPFGSAIRLVSNITLSGEGAKTKLMYSQSSDDDEAIGVPSNGRFKNIVLEDFDLTGPGSAIDKEIDGIQLRAVEESRISGVRVREFSRDGIHLYYNKGNGVNSSTISDCESSSNGRNGISITSGSRNVIERCKVFLNNIVRRGIYGVAGISLESDSINIVSENRVRWNVINDNKHHGIGLAEEEGGNFGNVICENSLSGNLADQINESTEDPANPNMYIRNTPQPRRKDVEKGSVISNEATSVC